MSARTHKLLAVPESFIPSWRVKVTLLAKFTFVMDLIATIPKFGPATCFEAVSFKLSLRGSFGFHVFMLLIAFSFKEMFRKDL
jgi:hypothetical protein